MKKKKRIKKYDRKMTGKRYKEENELNQEEKAESVRGKWRDTESRQRS